MATATADAMTFRYGRCNFAQIRIENRFFADNTNVIRDIEKHEADHMLLCRPARFGKSLLLSMMQSYYDERTSDDEFRSLFSDLDIGNGTKPGVHSYKVFQLSLTINTHAGADVQTILVAVNSCVNAQLREFKSDYDLSFPLVEDACSSLRNMCTELKKLQRVEKKPQRLLVLIDEYDRLANILLEAGCHDDSLREKLVPIKNVFLCLKDLSARVNIRTFTVGISPLPLAQMSVWNMVDDLSLNPAFACALGLTEQHVALALEQLGVPRESLVQQNMLALLRHYFNGYCFAGTDTALFNPQLIVRFCQLYQENEAFKQLVRDPEWKTWDDALQVTDFMGNSDANVLPAESLFRILAQLPVCTTLLLQALASPAPPEPEAPKTGISVTAAAIRNGLMPSEMKRSREQVLWFMYFHGLITSCPHQPADSSEAKPSGDAGSSANKSPTSKTLLPIARSYRLQLPNRLVRDDHLTELKRRVSGESKRFANLLISPSATKLHDLLWWMVSQQQTEHSNNFVEDALQAELECGLRCMCIYEFVEGSCPKVYAGKKFKKDGNDFECDLLIVCECPAIVLHIELKRITPGDIDLSDKLSHHLDHVIDSITGMTKADMLALKILQARRQKYKQAGSVDAVLSHANDQLRERLPLLRTTWPTHVVHQFGVVQVAWRLVVEELITST